MDIIENGICIGADEPGLPGADWNGGLGGDRGPAGPPGPIEPRSNIPWYVLQNMRQERRKQKGKH